MTETARLLLCGGTGFGVSSGHPVPTHTTLGSWHTRGWRHRLHCVHKGATDQEGPRPPGTAQPAKGRAEIGPPPRSLNQCSVASQAASHGGCPSGVCVGLSCWPGCFLSALLGVCEKDQGQGLSSPQLHSWLCNLDQDSTSLSLTLLTCKGDCDLFKSTPVRGECSGVLRCGVGLGGPVVPSQNLSTSRDRSSQPPGRAEVTGQGRGHRARQGSQDPS